MRSPGFSLIELMATLAIAGMLLVTMQSLMAGSTQLHAAVRQDYEQVQRLQFALDRMLRHVAASPRLLLPMRDHPGTVPAEHIRDQTVGSGGVTAVLAMTLPPSVDRDGDGVADADNDGDGRVDEDTPADMTADGAPGIVGVDDDGDGVVDNAFLDDDDDDERALLPLLFDKDEDKLDGVDNDGDGSIDEDWGRDHNADGQPGVLGVDDDLDGSVDEGSNRDDDEDGVQNEDWLDAVVYFLSGSSLVERIPVPWDENLDGSRDGLDFVEAVVLEDVTRFRVELVETEPTQFLVDLTLYVTDAQGAIHRLHGRTRAGSTL